MILDILSKRCLDAIARHLGISMLVETKVGVKAFNRPFSSELLASFKVRTLGEAAPDNLLICMDFLKDQYTLLGVGIIKSPHFGLMSALMNKADLRQSDYVRRLEAGTLDGRLPMRLSEQIAVSMRRRFSERLREVQSEGMRQVMVFCVSGNTYVADGKHRAALCALLGIKPILVDVTPFLASDQMKGFIRKMRASLGEYRKHMDFAASIGRVPGNCA